MIEARKNPVIKLKAQAKKFDFSKLRAAKDNKGANSGKTMYGDFHRISFVINEKIIDKTLIHSLIERAWNRYSFNEFECNLVDESGNLCIKSFSKSKDLVLFLKEEVKKSSNYRQIAKEVFKEMFNYAEAQVPSESILEELVTNCNQSSYYGGALMTNILAPALFPHGLIPQIRGTIRINCTDKNCISIKSDNEISITDTKLLTYGCESKEAVVCQLNNLLEFTLESQDGKDGVVYKNGKLSFTIPKKLESYQSSDNNLFDVIKKYFQKFCGKLGLKSETSIKQSLKKQLKVDSYLDNITQSMHCNKHVYIG
ncbi:MAG: hypothetical protein LKM44_00575 [Wolbachia endosymbiont of Meromenopon meropis]|nr:hypothetical protein [Wolbachia endosymbiont of Meromenopon meropis]